MNKIDKATNLLFYKIYKNIESSTDYLHWAFTLIDADVKSYALNMLSSMNLSDSHFEFKDYLTRVLTEVGLDTPLFEVCARTYIINLCVEITTSTRDSFEVVKDIFQVVIELEMPPDLSIWIELDDLVDRVIYDEEHYKPNETELKNRIINESMKYLAFQGDEDIS